MLRKSFFLAVAACAVAAMMVSGPAKAADARSEAPAEIKIGTLYASTGAYAGISTTINLGLKIWIDQKNAEGGVFVKPFNKKFRSSSWPMTTSRTHRRRRRSITS